MIRYEINQWKRFPVNERRSFRFLFINQTKKKNKNNPHKKKNKKRKKCKIYYILHAHRHCRNMLFCLWFGREQREWKKREICIYLFCCFFFGSYLNCGHTKTKFKRKWNSRSLKINTIYRLFHYVYCFFHFSSSFIVSLCHILQSKMTFQKNKNLYK